MEAIYWQARIIVSVLGLYFLFSHWSRKVALGVAFIISVEWTWFTFGIGLYGRLLIFQLCLTWVSFLIAFYLHEQEEKKYLKMSGLNEEIEWKDKIISIKNALIGKKDQVIDEKDETISKRDSAIEKRDKTIGQKDEVIENKEKLINSLRATIDDFSGDTPNLIKDSLRRDPFIRIEGKEHVKFLKESLSQANQSIIILSGWILSTVVDGKFLSQLRSVVKSGVDIYIGYGFDSYGGAEEINPDSKAVIEKLKNLEKWAENEKGNLVVKKIEKSHEKLLLLDDNYTIIGSINWLSNTGANTGELSVKIESVYLTTELKQRTVAKFT